MLQQVGFLRGAPVWYRQRGIHAQGALTEDSFGHASRVFAELCRGEQVGHMSTDI